MKNFKRIAALLMAFTMLTLAACGDPEDGVSDPSGVSSDASAPTEESREVFVDEEAMAAVDALYTGEVDRTLKRVNLAQGLSYTLSRAPSDPYLDAGGMLTDGKTSESFNKTDWVGFSGSEGVTINVDLGEVVDNIAELDIGFLRVTDYAVNLPSRVTFLVSDDGETYTTAGDVLTPEGLANTIKITYTAALPGTIHARYIRITVSGLSGWTFADEMGVYKYEGEDTGDDSETVKDYYGELELETGGEPTYWDSSESDYNDTLNLIAGKPVQIELVDALRRDHATTFYNSPESNPALTDGKHASSAAYTDSAFFRFTNGEGRNLYFDLGHVSAVTGIRASFLREDGPNVKLPAGLLIYGSVDGEEWKVFHHVDSVYSEGASSIAQVDETFDKAYKVRYIRITFSVLPHVYCDEIEILGRKNVEGAAELSESTAVNDLYPQAFITPDQFDGVENMILSYNCNPSLSSGGKTTVEEYLPHVGYFDREGNLTDTFFDSFLYLPYTAFNYSDNAKSLDGWKFYIENQFTADRNVDALNTAVGQVKEELGLDDYTVSVFFSILYTFTESTSFGDIDGDGVVENFTKIEDRKKAIKWIIDEQVRLFEQGNYENLELYGFYWFEESIAFSDPHETELIRYASDYLHSLGYKLMWIPYYQASGFSDWKELGFDMACMQPNYAFSGQATVERLYDNAETTRRLGMCVEIEIGQYDAQADILRYKEYLAVGAETGYMNAVKCYYQGGVPGAFYYAYKSTDPLINSVYHDTYLFAKGKYDPSEIIDGEIADPSDLEMDTTSGRGVTGSLNVETESDYRVRIETSPKYGTLRFGGGTVTYTPLSGFAGTDTFTVYLEYIHGDSKTATVTVRVHEK